MNRYTQELDNPFMKLPKILKAVWFFIFNNIDRCIMICFILFGLFIYTLTFIIFAKEGRDRFKWLTQEVLRPDYEANFLTLETLMGCVATFVVLGWFYLVSSGF